MKSYTEPWTWTEFCNDLGNVNYTHIYIYLCHDTVQRRALANTVMSLRVP